MSAHDRWLRISAVIYRYLYLYRRSVTRAGEIVFWPVMDLLVWGFLTLYLRDLAVSNAILFLIGSLIFWDFLYRSQQATTVAFIEEMWSKNLLNIFLSPISVWEYILGTCLLGLMKSLLTALLLGVLAWFCYAFNILSVGPMLIPFVLSLLLFGWALAMFTMALMLRFGQAAEALVWGIPFLVQPFSAVFYPVDVLPVGLRVIAYMLPSTYVFEGMRAVLIAGKTDWTSLLIAFGLNILYLGAGAAFFAWMFRLVREKGYLSRLGME